MHGKTEISVRWTPRLRPGASPAYRAIADALEADIRAGRIAAGDPLPTQRELANRLGLNFTTITRAYAEARRRGLLTATVGRGTFVADSGARVSDADTRRTSDHDLSVNAPPVPTWLPAAFRQTLARIANDHGLAQDVLSYESRLGSVRAREAGVEWLRARGLVSDASRVVVTAGAQHALSLLLSTFARPGQTVLTEALAYPGLHSAAAMAGVRLEPVQIDDEGLRPDMLDDACERLRPQAIFCVPTLHNPTAAVMSIGRRRDVLAVARRHRIRIVEDDICGPLYPDATPLAALDPEIVVHIASLSKYVAPGLRTAFVQLPGSTDAAQLDAAVRASMLMLSALPLEVAASWIADGTAKRAVADIRREAMVRGVLARDILGPDCLVAPAGSLHGWLTLPSTWSLAGFVAQAQQQGVRVAPADWYVTRSDGHASVQVPSAVRITLGAEADRVQFEHALRTLATILAQPVGSRPSTL